MNELNPDYIPLAIGIPFALVLWAVIFWLWRMDRRSKLRIVEVNDAEVAPPAFLDTPVIKKWPDEPPFVWVKRNDEWIKAFPKIQENGQWRDMTWEEVYYAFKEDQEWLSLLQSAD